MTRHPHVILRGLCPCAHCQGHDPTLRWVEGTESLPKVALEIVDIEQVGNYALGLTWGDRHTGGIYTFEYLRELSALDGWPTERLVGYTRP